MNTNTFRKKEDKKGGLAGLLSGLFGGGSSSAGGGALGGLGSLFASKAGIMGVLLGVATISAGVGVVYNFVGPSSKPIYNQALFQGGGSSDFSSEQSARGAQAVSSPGLSSPSLDMVRQEAKKEFAAPAAAPGAAESSATTEEAKSNAAAEGGADNSAAAPANPLANSSAGPSSTFKKASFGQTSNLPKLNSGGSGMSGGIGMGFQQVSRNSAQASNASAALSAINAGKGKTGAVKTASRAAGNYGKSGAWSQAKGIAKKSGSNKSSTMEGSKSSVDWDNGASGNVSAVDSAGVSAGGTGSGGTGVSSDPGTANAPTTVNNSTVPTVSESSYADATPWKKVSKLAMYSMIAALALIAITSLLAKTAWGVAYAQYVGYLAIGAAALSTVAGAILWMKYKQKTQGMMYTGLGALLTYQAYQAMSNASDAAKANAESKELLASKGTEIKNVMADKANSVYGKGAGNVMSNTTVNADGSFSAQISGGTANGKTVTVSQADMIKGING